MSERIREQIEDGHTLIWCTANEARALLAEVETTRRHKDTLEADVVKLARELEAARGDLARERPFVEAYRECRQREKALREALEATARGGHRANVIASRALSDFFAQPPAEGEE